MEFRGGFGSKSEVWARRQGVIPQAGRFVSVSVTIQEQVAPLGVRGFTGLRLVSAGRAGRTAVADFTVEFGLRESAPHTRRTPTISVDRAWLLTRRTAACPFNPGRKRRDWKMPSSTSTTTLPAFSRAQPARCI